MSFFSKILEKLGLKKDTAGAGTSKPVARPMPAGRSGSGAKPDSSVAKDNPFAPRPAPAPMSEVDVVSKLEGLAAANPAKLNWKVSIVDLLKLLDLESSFDARKELATELGCPADLMGDSAKMNTWLHKEVLRQIAKNGGNIPKALLD